MNGDVPACHTWPVPEPLPVSLSKHVRVVVMLKWWQREMCAVCGRVVRLELDHDHATDAVRGYLCHSCNTRESNDAHGRGQPVRLFSLYRERTPAQMLNLRGRYGWWTGDLDEWPDGCAVPSYRLAERITAARLASIGVTATNKTPDPVAGAEYLCWREAHRVLM